ncbi:hypothetical protein E3J61_02090 [Candidatus Dependentiae bacterium]|nr:MAG: hypothetical protein E3J61_02090 [Candidatus Dependentiae bacterium]
MKKLMLLVCGILSVSVGVVAMQEEAKVYAASRCVISMPGATPHGTMPREEIVSLGDGAEKRGSEASDKRPLVTEIQIGDSEGEQAVAWAVLKSYFLVCRNLVFHSGGNLE